MTPVFDVFDTRKVMLKGLELGLGSFHKPRGKKVKSKNKL